VHGEPRSDKISVKSECVMDTQGAHDHKARAVGYAPFLVGEVSHQLDCLVVANGLYPKQSYLLAGSNCFHQRKSLGETNAPVGDCQRLGQYIIGAYLLAKLPSEDPLMKFNRA
jgi:hypothetical protein